MTTWVVDPTHIANSYFDAEYSLRRWIHESYANVPILVERHEGNFVRPTFSVEMGSSYVEDVTPNWVDQQRNMRVRYFGNSKADCQNVLGVLEHQLIQKKRRLPLYLRNWAYPSVALQEKLGLGSLLPGTYHVRVSARSILGDWSVASEDETIVVSQNSAINILIPSLLGGLDYFKYYAIFVGRGDAQSSLQVIIPPSSLAAVTQYLLTGYVVSGNLAEYDDPGGLLDGSLILSDMGIPPETSEVRYRFLSVAHEETMFMENPSDLGIWDGIFNLTTKFVNARQRLQKVPMTQATSRIVEV